MTLRLTASLAERGVAVDVALGSGETLALLGPNGAGKSTVLGMLAGLVRPDEGAATLDGATLFDLPSTWLAPHRRSVALLAQDALLFPHLTARDNVAFAARTTGLARAAARDRAGEWLGRTGADAFADRRPAGLSGGQAQRVAIARALAAEPRLTLLDEPLASLDVGVAAELRLTLAAVLAGRTAVLVTHEVLDAYLLADRVAVLHDGRVVEQGPTRQVLGHPRHPFTAEIAGLGLLTGRRTARGIRTDDGLEVAGTTTDPISAGTPVTAIIRPSSVTVHPVGTDGIPSRVTALEPRDDLVRVRTDRITALLPAAVVAELRLSPGTPVALRVAPDDVSIAPL
ncbi:ABC transporter ATP-binding protein [Leifsonia sp. ZF2019]|uniref:sulfate/molybdate ABC transporter ATP-binding protein n=1 Tax=Leifsonia sp. ZF2019 TaxID=2781978 RepID=UPI001CC0669C|nr:ABC transporter ATP-binding protein [Leifsonia sp. ZF2019]UAJ80902.1 ABC transporter ATP-binding protein [Leifsonia sp. ZF2019]